MLKRAFIQLSELGRRQKQVVLIVADLVAIPTVLWVTWSQLAGYWWLPIPGGPEMFLLATAASVACMVLTGVYRAVVRAFDESFLRALLLGIAIYSVALVSALTILPVARQPFSAAFLSTVFSSSLIFFWIWGSRTAIRSLIHGAWWMGPSPMPVVIYGAGSAGRQLLAALRREVAYKPVAFLDDDANLHGSVIGGLPVRRWSSAQRLFERHKVAEVFLAMPTASRQARRQLLQRLEPFPVHVRVLPSISQLAKGNVQFSDLREVEVEDLLGRESVAPKPLLFSANIAGLTVMVTGAGGSIGSELCRQVLVAAPRRLLLVEHSEFALYTIHQELQRVASDTEIVPILCSVLDERRLAELMTRWAVSTIYHAAAYKHVPLVESNPLEGLRNNSVGTLRLARAAIEAKVQTFVLISTDKAVRPTNVMGASKRLAELVLQMLAAEPGESPTRFTMVRFGNVLASSGSVVPLFRRQIAAGGPITLTHPEVTRYFMTISEAAQLVIQAGAMGVGGDVFVLDMGAPVKIIDLARLMIRLSGFDERTPDNPDGDIEITTVGLRPGEKLYEELLIGSGDAEPTQHPKIMKVFEPTVPKAALMSFLAEVGESLGRERDSVWLREQLLQLVEGYTPERAQASGLDAVNTVTEVENKGSGASSKVVIANFGSKI